MHKLLLWVKVCWVCVTRRSDWMILSLIWSENNNLINHAVYKYPGHTRSPSHQHQHQPEHAAPLRCAEVSPAHCDPLIDVISWPLFCWGLEMLILFWDTAVCDNVSQRSVADPAPAPCYSIWWSQPDHPSHIHHIQTYNAVIILTRGWTLCFTQIDGISTNLIANYKLHFSDWYIHIELT